MDTQGPLAQSTINARHKVILFVTVVLTGSALLAGAQLNESLGFLMLGSALAWVAGSKAALRAFNMVRRFPAKSLPSLRILLSMALGGCLFGAVLVWSNLNSFLSSAAMALLGIVISFFLQPATKRPWLNYLIWGVATLGFFLCVVGATMIGGLPADRGERVGQMTIPGFIALLIGIFWLPSGLRVIQAGIAKPELQDTSASEPHIRKRTFWLYILLVLGSLVLVLWLGLLAFTAFSDSVFALQHTDQQSSANAPSYFSPIIFLMLLAWLPYCCWKAILAREPNIDPPNVALHRRITFAVGAVLTAVLSIAITFGIQNGHDRFTTFQVESGMDAFKNVATQIGAIKSRDLRTTKDYIDAYGEIDSLLPQFDEKLKDYTRFLADAEQRDRDRGPLNIQRFYKNDKDWLTWDNQMFALLSEDSAVTAKEVLVAKQMAGLPENEQVEFWKNNFQPLLENEDQLRKKITAIAQHVPGHP